jgi:polysaccharide pyruvyl transferase WcaK-like protein
MWCGLQFGLHLRVQVLDATRAPAWTAGHPLTLSYHWLSDDGQVHVWDGLRTPLPAPAHAASAADVDLLVQAPDQPGHYTLQVCALLEGLRWLDASEATVLSSSVQVRTLQEATGLVVVAGGSGFGNCGDEALLFSALKAVADVAPDATCVISANNPAMAARTLRGMPVGLLTSLRMGAFGGDRHYQQADDVFRTRWQELDASLGHDSAVAWPPFVRDPRGLQRLNEAICHATLVLVHGGGVLTSATRSRLWELALLARWAQRRQVPVAWRSHQLGPFEAEDRALAAGLLSSASFVSTRDVGESSDHARALDARIPVPVHEAVDDAFLWRVPPPAWDTPARRLQPWPAERSYICACFRDNPSVGVTARAFEAFVHAVRTASRLSGLPVVLLPMGRFDIAVLQRVAERLGAPATVWACADDWLEPPAIAQRAALMISVPHHPLIFALQGGVPVLSLAEGAYYVAKNRGSLRGFGLQGFAVDVSVPDADRLIERRLRSLLRHLGTLSRAIAARAAAWAAAQETTRQAFTSCWQQAQSRKS